MTLLYNRVILYRELALKTTSYHKTRNWVANMQHVAAACEYIQPTPHGSFAPQRKELAHWYVVCERVGTSDRTKDFYKLVWRLAKKFSLKLCQSFYFIRLCLFSLAKVILQSAASAGISGVFLRISNPKCDWTNAYSLYLKDDDYWHL